VSTLWNSYEAMQTGPLYATCVSCSFWFIVDAYFITTQREGGREGGRGVINGRVFQIKLQEAALGKFRKPH